MALKQNKYRFFIVFLFCMTTHAYAQIQDEEDILLNVSELTEDDIDSAFYFRDGEQHDNNIKPLNSQFNENIWRQKSKALNFEETADTLDKKEVSKNKRSSFNFSTYTKYLWLIPVLFILILILVKIMPLLMLKNPKIKKEIVFKIDHLEEDEMKQLEIESELERALFNGDYKRAFRLRYLDVLKQLISKNLIFYKKGKTNFEYLTQLSGLEVFEPFRMLTMRFDDIWYGELPLDKENYESMGNLFTEFYNTIINH